MGASFEIQLVNGLTGDPAVCVSFTQTGESLLFDAGTLENLSNRELLKIRVVAITHTHVDHFIGFDRLIRVNVPHFRTLEVVGPTGITANIRGKLAGYTWNLLEPDQLTFIVHEVSRSGAVISSVLSNTSNFETRPIGETPAGAKKTGADVATTIPLRNSDYTLRAITVDHGTDVLAYHLSMPASAGINKAELKASGLRPGPWISDLQRMATNGEIAGALEIEGTNHDALGLADRLIEPKKGESLTYVTDMAFTEINVQRLQALLDHPTDLLICEANYRAEHKKKARDKSHLTTRQAALIAALLPARKLQIFHISNVYGGDSESSVRESEEALLSFEGLSPERLWETASEEILSST